MSAFSTSVPVLGTVMLLVVLGGIGFPVLDELRGRLVMVVKRRRPPRMTLHARVVLATSALLVGGTTVVLYVLEAPHSMQGLGFGERALASAFHAVSLRTAGFDTVDLGRLGMPTVILTCCVMAVGASPGSTGGGLKTTTAATLFAALRAELRGHPAPRLFDRTVPTSLVRRALGLFFLGFGWLLLSLLVLFGTEKLDPLALVFETVSALSTTGLSMGITSQLSPVGKLVITVTMLLGRVGPLTAALALADREKKVTYSLPEERVQLG